MAKADMNPRDYNYLRLQFWNAIYRKKGTEFQRFFEDVMEKAFPDFRRVRSYGSSGDGGNDGFRPLVGIYYQVYAPRDPEEKEQAAAKKLKEDFQKLKREWPEIASIRQFFFVFNDEGEGASIHVYKALAELKTDNPGIDFDPFTPKKLEEVFIGLSARDILALGFDIDATKALSNAYQYLAYLEIDLDNERASDARKGLDRISPIIEGLKDEGLTLAFEILLARTLVKLERVDEATAKLEELRKTHSADPRAYLHLAEIELNHENFEKNLELLAAAEALDPGHPLLTLQKLIRAHRLKHRIAPSGINEAEFPAEPRMKSNFYRIYSFLLADAGDYDTASCFINEAIRLNPEKLHNYDAKISHLERRAFAERERDEGAGSLKDVFKALLEEIVAVEKMSERWGALSPRNQSLLNYRKFTAYRILENSTDIRRLARESFGLLMQCHFDQLIENLLMGWLWYVEPPPAEFVKLLKYTESSRKKVSDSFAKLIVLQFVQNGGLVVEGRSYFETIGNKYALDLVASIEQGDVAKAVELVKDDPMYAVALVNTCKEFPELRKGIIKILPDDGSIQKEKLLLLINYDEGKIDEAFELLKEFDLSTLRYSECDPILKVAKEKGAWDFAAEILQKLLEQERDARTALQLKLDLFMAFQKLERFVEMIRIGEGILASSEENKLLNNTNKEILLGHTALTRLKRGEFIEAKVLVEQHRDSLNTFGFKVGVEAAVYLKTGDAQRALAAIVDGIKQIKAPSPEQYGRLYLAFTEIKHLMDFSFDAAEKVGPDCFVKLKEQGRWFFVGDGEELDATKISSTDAKYRLFLEKKVGDSIVFGSKYRSSNSGYTIENILPIEKYICWQCHYQAEELSVEGRWDLMEVLDVPTAADGTPDLTYVVARLEDEKKKHGEFFDLYCRENLPIAVLAASEGGFANAVGTVVSENRGFINFSTGEFSEINQQKQVSQTILSGRHFYLDGTSALILSQTGLMETVHAHLTGLKVPQSVITFLLETREKFAYGPGQLGHMTTVGGKLSLTPTNRADQLRIERNFQTSIKLLESRPAAITAISSASKSPHFFEQEIPAALSDACILAQRQETAVLTEDYLYLHANEFETKKKVPEYCSSFALVRTLYEQKKLPFDQYLNFFAYLASCRFRFLPLSTDDIEKAVFGDGVIKVVRPERIRLLNFQLTLSVAYGVPFDTAFVVVGRFLVKILMDDTIPTDTAERIFVEILSTFPVENGDKKQLGIKLLGESVRVLRQFRQRIVVGTKAPEKIDALSRLAEIYSGSQGPKIEPA
jgi:tetratricopeptide (TPR) repeat protein